MCCTLNNVGCSNPILTFSLRGQKSERKNTERELHLHNLLRRVTKHMQICQHLITSLTKCRRRTSVGRARAACVDTGHAK